MGEARRQPGDSRCGGGRGGGRGCGWVRGGGRPSPAMAMHPPLRKAVAGPFGRRDRTAVWAMQADWPYWRTVRAAGWPLAARGPAAARRLTLLQGLSGQDGAKGLAARDRKGRICAWCGNSGGKTGSRRGWRRWWRGAPPDSGSSRWRAILACRKGLSTGISAIATPGATRCWAGGSIGFTRRWCIGSAQVQPKGGRCRAGGYRRAGIVRRARTGLCGPAPGVPAAPRRGGAKAALRRIAMTFRRSWNRRCAFGRTRISAWRFAFSASRPSGVEARRGLVRGPPPPLRPPRPAGQTRLAPALR